MTSACARTSGSANPVITTQDVRKRPKSAAGFVSEPPKSSLLPQCEKMALGSGARTNVSATISGSQFCQSAQERMMRRNPIARTNESNITVLSPATIIAIGCFRGLDRVPGVRI